MLPGLTGILTAVAKCCTVDWQKNKTGDLEALIQRIRGRLTVLRSVTMIALSAVEEGGALSAAESVGIKVRPKNGNS